MEIETLVQRLTGHYWKHFLTIKKSCFFWNDFIVDFQKKVEIFKEFFAKKCMVIPNPSKRLGVFIRKTDKYLWTVTFYENEIKKALRNLDPSKAHGHDMLSIRMLKICDDSLCRPLGLIFHPCFENGQKLSWILLLPICGKIFGRPIYSKLFHFFQ